MSETSIARLGFVLDCADPERMAEFWAPALGYTNVGLFGAYCLLVPPKGGIGPRLLLQQVPEPKRTKNRVHLDLDVHDVDAEVARLVALGATQLDTAPVREHGTHWIRMTDPEGNEFCICAFTGV